MDRDQVQFESDALYGADHPRLSKTLIGHETAFQTFTKCHREGNLHHAWLLSGSKGIGKATLAWKLVYELANSVIETQNQEKSSLLLKKKIDALSLSTLFLCRRPYDEKTKRLKKFITIDEIRNLKSFFQMSATENEWRVAVVDCADELNKSAANALLKILEEPPHKSILIIISNQLGRLPATVRSRCRVLHIKKLSQQQVEDVLINSNYSINDEPLETKLILSIIANGSAGMAITAINKGGVSLFRDCLEILTGIPNFDRKKILKLAETVKNNIESFRFLSSIILLIIARLALLTANVEMIKPSKEENILIKKINNWPDLSNKLAKLYCDLSKLFLSGEELNLNETNLIFNSFVNIEKSLAENRDE